MYRNKRKLYRALGVSLLISTSLLTAKTAVSTTIEQIQTDTVKILSVKKLNPSTVQVNFNNKEIMYLDFYGDNIFRIFQDNKSSVIRDPLAEPAAKILVDNPRKPVHELKIREKNSAWTISTKETGFEIEKNSGLFKIYNLKNKQLVTESTAPVIFNKKKVIVKLKESPEEYFYGGGVQNGRFSHKGKSIAIENTNNWTDGGVASPTPFYWSTNGYGVMWYTFKKGKYDFGNTEKGSVKLNHDSEYLDLFFMVSDSPVGILNDFYQLTGNPILLPKFGFYQGHLNAYNRDYWKEDDKGILFEDGKKYKESSKNEGGIKESLNGENSNYQFSARAVIDRYEKHDMPLGWLLPNDGYGAGYGQEKTLDGNIQNLKKLGDYARSKGVEIGLWTQSDLHPKDSVEALLQRDIVKEVRDAGVRVLKTDVAWVGAGYSFGLNGVSDVGHIMPYYGGDARPFIISLDGWAGTQRYAGIWSGDQTGGQWEYIRFHIPTYIGSGLSGQPNITSDMDGIFGGKNPKVNTRDFQWKTFTPMELNMDGWGSNEKYPHALGEPYTSINRNYLKWKSELMPYAYSIAKEAVDGKPMIRALMLDFPNSYTFGPSTQYQYLYGPSLLIAPIYQETQADTLGNDVRNGIYLPEGNWIDYFSGDLFPGNIVVNNFKSPIWKTPVFVKAGAIIPRTNSNNNVQQIKKSHRIYEFYPEGNSHFYEYDDDGITQEYLNKHGVYTCIESNVIANERLNIIINATEGNYNGFEKNKSTELRINVTSKPKKLSLKIGKKKVKLKEVNSQEELIAGSNVFFFQEKPNLNEFSSTDSEFESVNIIKNPLLLVNTEVTDVSLNPISLQIEGFVFKPENRFKKLTGPLTAPISVQVPEENTKAYSLQPKWEKIANADYYEIEFDSLNYSYIQDDHLLFEGLKPETIYNFKIRSVNKDGFSEWKEFQKKTKSNPLQFAINGLTGETSVPNQGSEGINNLFDFDEGNMWHTKWGQKAVPFDMVVDLNSFNTLDKFEYLPRSGRGNGILLEGRVAISNDKESWTEVGGFKWDNNDSMKVFSFEDEPRARFVKLSITKAVGDFGSGRELYVFKVPGTDSYRPGDINNDQLIDINDLTSYTNYTGLRLGDADFEGYVGNGDINNNGLIDAYDISAVATKLEGGVELKDDENLGGTFSISASKVNYNKDDIIDVQVKSNNLRDVNAFSFALPYSPQDFEFVKIDNHLVKQMKDLTNDRMHSNGQKALYPTFVNLGDQEQLDSKDGVIITIKLKAKRSGKFTLKPKDGIIVSKGLKSIKIEM